MDLTTPFPEVRKAFLADPAALLWQTPGIYLVDKPQGKTSHDMVYAARRRLGLKRIGHGGTLDPLATGLLLILAGSAARLFDDLQPMHKTYRARLRLGLATDTQDITGQVLEERSAAHVDRAMFEAALAPFQGDIMQTPPMYSSCKHNGQSLHKLARQGVEVEREARPVSVYDLQCLDFINGEAELLLTVSRGFYVRTLIHDLGQSLNCGATMTALRRLAIGPFKVEDAVAAENLAPGQPPAKS